MTEILVPLDGSAQAEAVITHAARLAAAINSPITLLQVYPGPLLCSPLAGIIARPGGVYNVWDIPRDRHTGPTAAAAKLLEEHGLVVRKLALSGDPATGIFAYLRRHIPHPIIAFAVAQQGQPPAWPLGKTATDLLLSAPGWSLWVPSTACAAPTVFGYHSIIIPLDGSAMAEMAVAQAQQLAAPSGATLLLLSVLPAGVEEAQKEARATYLTQLAHEYAQPGLTIDTELLVGAPATAIVERARQVAPDLIVLTTHGTSAHSNLGVGDVAGEILAAGPGAILLGRAGAAIVPRNPVAQLLSDAVDARYELVGVK